MGQELVPAGFEFEDDMPHERPADTPNWSESYAVWAYMEDQYLYTHFQRHPDDSEMWRAFAMMLRNDGSVIVTHNFGRQLSSTGPGYQQVHCCVEKPFERFRVNVDSVAQVSSVAALRESQIASLNGDLIGFQADLRLDSISPTYQPMPLNDERDHSNSKWTLYTPCRVDGYVTIGTEKRNVNCLGWRDHSAGVRSFENMTDGFMFTGIFPSGKSYMAIGVGGRAEGTSREFLGVGGVTIDGKVSYMTKLTPPLAATCPPESNSELGTFTFESEFGTSNVKMRTLNQGCPIGLFAPNYESIGLPNGLSSRLFYHDWRLEIEWDGEIGIGGWEPCVSNADA